MARDEHVYDLVDFTVWYDGALGLRRWLEAPPVAEVQDEREIALAGMLMTRSAPRGFKAPPSSPRTAADGDPLPLAALWARNRSLLCLGRTKPDRWTVWNGVSGCFCGQCEAAWRRCGWICPRFYRVLFGARADP